MPTKTKQTKHRKMSSSSEMTFWQHLDVLRKIIVRMSIAIIALSFIMFALKDFLFGIVLAPTHSDFVLYSILNRLTSFFGSEPLGDFHISLVATQLTSQFLAHVHVSIYAAIIVASPYIIYQLMSFVSPALHSNERRYAYHLITWGYIMFGIGAAMSYFMIFPLSVRFLATYQVSESISNLITIESYLDTLLLLTLFIGIASELPVLCWLLGQFGLLTSKMMRRYRKHAIVAIAAAAAIITPTSDAVTMLIVALPIYLLYEVGIMVVRNPKER